RGRLVAARPNDTVPYPSLQAWGLVPALRQLVLRATPRVVGLDHRELALGGREVEIRALAGLLLPDVRLRGANPRFGPLQVEADLVRERVALRPVERAPDAEQALVRLERGGRVRPVAAAAAGEREQHREEAEQRGQPEGASGAKGRGAHGMPRGQKIA